MKYINLLLLLLIVIDLVQLGIKISTSKGNADTLPAGFVSCTNCTKPDIYFIVADEYAAAQELKDIFHFDNSDFENALKKRGFYLIDSSRSNYNYTPFCMASIFSMDYLHGIEGRNQSKHDRQICYPLINQNSVTQFLRSEGYSIKNLSVFKFDDQLPEEHSSFFLTGKDLLSSQTFISRINRDLRFQLITKFHIHSEMERIANVDLNSVTALFNKTIEQVTKSIDKPGFIYAHLMMPHYPYFFDEKGNKNPVRLLMEGEQVRQNEYIGYLKYANKKFIYLIDYILQHSKQPPVIIFMGDHGFRHFDNTVGHNYYFMNFNAVYLPGKNYEQFYKTMSTVNQFRVFFNAQFGQKIPLQKDSSIFLKE